MYRIVLNTVNGDYAFRAKYTPLHDKVLELSWSMFQEYPILLKKKDWAKSTKTICDYTGIKLKVSKADGRKLYMKSLDWFSWRRIFWLYLEYVKGPNYVQQ